MVDPLNFYNDALHQYGFSKSKVIYTREFMDKYFNSSVQESTVFQMSAFNRLLTGKMYTFNYNPLNKDILDFYDTRPLIISLKNFKAKTTKNNIELGLNINFIPPEVRLWVLSRFYNVYKGILDYNEEKMSKGEVLNQKELFTASYNIMRVLDGLLEFVGKTAYRFALRNYISERIVIPKSVDYDDWAKAVFIDSQEMAGASISEIYKKYWDYKLKRNIFKKRKK